MPLKSPQAKSLQITGSATILAAAQGETQRRFDLLAYTGEPLKQWWCNEGIVVDLSTIKLRDGVFPILHNHRADEEEIVGQSERAIVEGSNLTVSGSFMMSSERAQGIIAKADEKFRWQVSIGADSPDMDFVAKDATVAVNGRNYVGPVYVARNVELREVSFVVLGADSNTSAVVARRQAKLRGGAAMSFETWCVSMGFDSSKLDEIQMIHMKNLYDKAVAAGEIVPGTEDPPTPAADPEEEPPATEAGAPAPLLQGGTNGNPVANSAAHTANHIAAMQQQAAAEITRQSTIRLLCSGMPDPHVSINQGGKIVKVNLHAHAVANNWTTQQVELEILRAARPTPNLTFGSTNGREPATIMAAAIAQAGKLPNLERQFPAQVLEMAHSQYKSRIGLQQILIEAAAQNGYSARFDSIKSDLAGVLRAAFSPQIQGASSTFSLPGIFANTANKFLLAGFMGVDQAWQKIAAKRAVNDFKAITNYRMTGAFQFDKIGPNGEIKHATVGEESFTNQAATYAKMFAITRQQMINDDLGALTAVPQKIGRGSALKLNDVFWTAFLDNASFFASGNNNYFEGAATNLQASSLETAELKFRKQVDADGKPLGIEPAILLVPPEINRTAKSLMNSDFYAVGGGSSATQVPTSNTFKGTYEPVATPYLSNSSYTGYSIVAWYLLANPGDLPVIEVVFLNGVETPTVESADADFNTLGIQIRGYFDFGVTKQDSRGGVKSKGSA
jgi:hypothetical protein